MGNKKPGRPAGSCNKAKLHNKTITALPSIDLSKYNEMDRLPSQIETIVVNALIAFKADTKLVSRHYKLNREKVNEVYVKYYLNICKVLKSNLKGEVADEQLNDFLEISGKHIADVKARLNETGNISTGDIATLTKIIDRIVEIKDQATKNTDSIINRLNDTILRAKTIEKMESGELGDTSVSRDNQASFMDVVAKALTQSAPSEAYDPHSEAHGGKKVYFYSLTNMALFGEYDSALQAASKIGCDSSRITKKKNDHTVYEVTLGNADNNGGGGFAPNGKCLFPDFYIVSDNKDDFNDLSKFTYQGKSITAADCKKPWLSKR